MMGFEHQMITLHTHTCTRTALMSFCQAKQQLLISKIYVYS